MVVTGRDDERGPPEAPYSSTVAEFISSTWMWRTHWSNKHRHLKTLETLLVLCLEIVHNLSANGVGGQKSKNL